MKKLIEQTENYNVYQSDFMGHTQTFRQWRNNHIEIQLNDNFAKANGHRSVEDMLNINKGMRESLMLTCGQIPQWITITERGEFTVKNTVSNPSFN
jgi:hypothetical protein